jgi:(p)ppGpp synthase/HD superfamily hydrolase
MRSLADLKSQGRTANKLLIEGDKIMALVRRLLGMSIHTQNAPYVTTLGMK